ncbi:hypothetical protein FRB99_006534 [Tulasnella sp. 403]|nr:hypothetical protein FRB99_006534 [Tulasnella sp. 403]
MADAESISLEETNKIRISLGLKPLTDDKAPADDKEKQAEDNYARLREQEKREKETSALAARIAKNKNKLELNRRLVGATLGDVDDGVDDTVKWIKRNKKKEKELAAKRQAQLDSQDALITEEYTEKDLAGLKVSHDFEDLAEGEDRILTLKDSRILDNEEDELLNVDMAEVEKDKQRHELKTKRRDYTGYDDDEFGADGLKKSVLAKYDEDILGASEKGFRLGSGTAARKPNLREAHEQTAISINKSLLSIDYAKNQEISDYADVDKAFKKPKTKKKKSTRRAPIDAELAALDGDVKEEGDAKMQVDTAPSREKDLDANFIDDEELQVALSKSRRQKVKRTKITPEEIAKRLAEEKADQEARAQLATSNGDTAMEDIKEEEEEGGLTFDDTTEFVRAITYDPTAPKQETINITIKTRRSPSAALDGMDVDRNDDEGESESEDEGAILNSLEQAMADVSAENNGDREDDGLGTTSETFGGGLAGALSILRKQGILNNGETDTERERIQKAHDKWLAEQRRKLAVRELDRMRSKTSNKDQSQREYENRLREQQDAREMMDAFKNYKPDVKIVYHDEYGREMGMKEAWKALSHRFHGKGSGKMKTEKRLKKIADEKKREAMISGDTPTSMNQAFQTRQEKAGQAHMVLSVGNRGAVPQLEEFLDNAALSKAAKSSKGSKGKKKDGGESTPIQHIDMTAFAASNSHLAPGLLPISARPVGSAEGSPAPPAGMMKPAFARISSEDVATPASSGSSEGEWLSAVFTIKTMYNQHPQYRQPMPVQDVVSGEQYRYALTNFRIAHEKVESQRQQLEEQERQVASLHARIAILEGSDDQGIRKGGNANQGGSSVDDFSIRTAASKLERLINRWAADVVRSPPYPLNVLRDAALSDLEGPQPETLEASPVMCQNLLRHAMSEVICEGIVNVLVVTNSNEANIQLTRIHEHIFTRDPTVAAVWRRQTFSAALDKCSPELCKLTLEEHLPSLYPLLSGDQSTPPPAIMAIMESAYGFSQMLHGSRTSSGGITDAFYRGYVPELGNILYPRQVELVKRCMKSESGEADRVGSCIFFGLVKMTRTPPNAPAGSDGQVPELAQTVVRRAQVICDCALGMVASSGPGNITGSIERASPDQLQGYGSSSYAGSPPPDSGYMSAPSIASSDVYGGPPPGPQGAYGVPDQPPPSFQPGPPPPAGYPSQPGMNGGTPPALRLAMPQ